MTDTKRARAHAAPADQGRGKRLWKNFFVKPGFRFRYTWYFVGAGLVIFGVTAALIERRLGEVLTLTNTQPMATLAEQGHVQDLFVEITKISLVGFSSYVIFSFLVAFLLSHRISGPMVALTDIIGQFKQGNYGYRRALRRRDELKEIHRELMELGESLEALAGGSATGTADSTKSGIAMVGARTRTDT